MPRLITEGRSELVTDIVRTGLEQQIEQFESLVVEERLSWRQRLGFFVVLRHVWTTDAA